MHEALRDLAQALFSGRAGGPWQTRSARVRGIASLVFGGERTAPDGLPHVPPPVIAPPPSLHGLSRHRGPAAASARALAHALVSGEFPRLARLLHDHVWVLWTDGALRRHRRADLVPFLSKLPGRPPLRVLLEEVRSYTDGELRSTLVRGVPDAIAALSRASDGITIMFSLETPAASLGRVMVMMSLDREGEWRAHNLLLPAADDAHVAGAPPVAPEDGPASVADRIVRHFVLGHRPHLRALRGRMMKQIWVAGGFAEPAGFEALAGGDRGAAFPAESVFLGTTAIAFSDLLASTARGAIDRIRRQAQEVWGRTFDRWTPRAATTRVAALEPATLRATAEVREIVTVLLGVRDGRLGEPRWRLGAILNEGEGRVS